MNRLFSKGIWLLLIITISTLSAQEKSISLDDINEGVFRAEYLSALRSMNNGKEYSVYNYDRKSKNSTIDVYDYKTGDKVRTLLNTAEIEGIDYIISYQFSDDETKLLLATKLKQIYRRSSVGIYYVYDLNLKELTLVSDHQIQEPTFNGDSSKLAYGYNNNLFVKDLNSSIEESLVVYRDILGYNEVVYDQTGIFNDYKSIPGGDKEFRRVLLRHSDIKHGAFSPLFGKSEIELIQVLNRKSRDIYEGRIWGDPGFIHLCFDINDMDTLREKAKHLGFPFTVDSAKAMDTFDMGDAGGNFAYIQAPEGTSIEFFETHKIPLIKKIGWNIDFRKRGNHPLPRWILSLFKFKRVK